MTDGLELSELQLLIQTDPDIFVNVFAVSEGFVHMVVSTLTEENLVSSISLLFTVVIHDKLKLGHVLLHIYILDVLKFIKSTTKRIDVIINLKNNRPTLNLCSFYDKPLQYKSNLGNIRCLHSQPFPDLPHTWHDLPRSPVRRSGT